ncbi:MAG: hypothetical protein RPR97_01070 [Colwellia sp.]
MPEKQPEIICDKLAQQDKAKEQKNVRTLLAHREPDRIKSRKARKHLREKRRKDANFVKQHDNAVGTEAHIASLDGFCKKSKLPHHFGELFNEARRFAFTQKEYIDSEGVVRSISKKGQRKLLEVLIVFIASCDFVSGQIGKPKSKYMDTTSHDAFMLQHAKRFGYAISSSSWYRYVEMLKCMNVFRGEAIRTFNENEGKTITRSEPSYKWLSKSFLTKIGAFQDHIRASVELAYNKAKKNGLSFVWKVKNDYLFTENKTASFDFSPPPNIKPS